VEQKKKKMMIDRSRPVAAISSPQTPAIVPIFERADKIQQLSKLTFGIPEIDCLLDFAAADRGAICIARSDKRNRDGGCYYYWHTNTLVTRLCVRALMSRQYGGLESPSIMFIDAGNCSDIYQTVNFARQYGLDIERILGSIIVSRSFTIHQLAGLIINDLEPAVQRFGAKLVVVSDLLKMFVQDPQIDTDEVRWLVKEVIKALQKLSTQMFLVVSLHDNDYPLQYRNYLMSIFDSCIDITTTTAADSQQKSLQLKISNRRHSGSSSSSRQLSMLEKDLQIVSSTS
jgi:Rad51